MEEYVRKVPYFNDYDNKKDLLKQPPVKDDDDSYEQSKIRDKKNNIQYIIKKRQDIKEIFNYAPDPNTRTQKEILKERKIQLKDELNQNYDLYEKRHPFFMDTVVKRDEITKNMKDALTNKYAPYEVDRSRISNEVSTKTMLLTERRRQYLMELRQNNLDDYCPSAIENVFLDEGYDYRNVVKNKNKDLTLKNYGFWHDPSDFIFSFPHIQAKGRGGWATEVVKAQIMQKRNDDIGKKMNIENIYELHQKENYDKGKRIFLMKNRFPFIKYSKSHCSVDNYYKEKPHMVIRHGGFQKWTS